MQAVILAGGKGTRLKPFTNNIPKPLVPIGDKAILEIVLIQLKKAGVNEIYLAVNHLANLIKAFFGDGSGLGLKIKYSKEEQELGTAGPLKLIDDLEENFLVMNGDILTTIGFNDLFSAHLKSKSIATIATHSKEVRIDLGVLEVADDGRFQNYIEKPTYKYTVSTGIYVFNKRVIEYIPSNKKFDMPNLILDLNKKNESINCYKGEYEWMDIGRVDDYQQAVEIFENNQELYLKNG
jgi:NDP-sugar pyrophosphorylase family protein